MAKGKKPAAPAGPRVEIQHEPPTSAAGGAWQVIVTAIASEGQNTLAGRAVQFFKNGVAEGSACQTDSDGRVGCLLAGLPSEKQISVEAQLAGTPTRARTIISAPTMSQSQKKEPNGFIVSPHRVGNHITLVVRVVDDNNHGIPKMKMTVVDSSLASPLLTVHLDEDGELEYSFTLRPGEERELAIYVAGYGDSGYRQTFKGRK